MGSPDRDGKGIAACLLYEFHCLIRIRIYGIFTIHEILKASYGSEFSLDPYALFMGSFYHFDRGSDVFLIWEPRSIEHDGIESVVYCLEAGFHTFYMVMLDEEGSLVILSEISDSPYESFYVLHVFFRSGGDLNYGRGAGVLCSLHYGHHALKGEYIESAYAVSVLICVTE